MISDGDILKIKSTTNMYDLIEHLGFVINQKGYILCPFHDDKRPSMQVFKGYTKKDGFYCRSCLTGGDIIKFIQLYMNMTFDDAATWIAHEFGIPIDEEIGLTEAERAEISGKIAAKIFSRSVNERWIEVVCSKLSMISGRIHLYESIMQCEASSNEAEPFTEIFCQMANRIPILKGEWDYWFDLYCDIIKGR